MEVAKCWWVGGQQNISGKGVMVCQSDGSVILYVIQDTSIESGMEAGKAVFIFIRKGLLSINKTMLAVQLCVLHLSGVGYSCKSGWTILTPAAT